VTGGSSPSLLTPGYSRRTALRFQVNSQADRVTPSHRFSSHGIVHQARLRMSETSRQKNGRHTGGPGVSVSQLFFALWPPFWERH
jgi:hypothetical protein